MKHILKITALITAIILPAIAHAIEDTETYSFPMQKGEELYVKVSDANVTIEGSSTLTEAQITITKKVKTNDEDKAREAFDYMVYNCIKEGSRVILESDYTNNKTFYKLIRGLQMSVDIQVVLPKEVIVNVGTSDGDLTLNNIIGDVNLRTSDGDIEIGNIAGMVQLKSSDGDIEVEKVSGELKLKTSDGDIEIDECDGSVEAKTSDGNLVLGTIKGDLNATTSDGNIEAKMLISPVNNCYLTTSDGNVKLKLAENIAADINMKVSDGHIQINHPNMQTNEFSKRSINGTLNGGGASISIKTSDGNISVGTF